MLKTNSRYVLFYCDDCEKLQPAISIFKDLHPSVLVETSSDIQDVLVKIKHHLPELLLVCLYDAGKDYMHLIKEIRMSAQTSSIPVLIYREMPDEDALRNAFKKIEK